MQKLTTGLLALLWAVGIGAAAQPETPLLARHVPPDVLFYAEAVISSAAAQGIDSLVADLSGRIGVAKPEPLDALFRDLGLHEWLGERAALALLPSASFDVFNANAVALAQIRDRAQVEALLREQANAREVPGISGAATSFVLGGVGVTVSDDLVIAAVGLAGSTLPAPGAPSLADHPPFRDVVAALPGTDYAAMAYFDPRGLVFALAAAAYDELTVSAINLPALSDSLGVFGAGLTRLDDRSYALDIAHVYGSRHIFGAIYAAAPTVIESVPLDPDWLAILPDDVAFVGQFTQPWPQLRTLLDAFSIGGNALRMRAFVSAAVIEGITGVDPIRSPLALIPASLSSAAIVNTIEGLLDMTDAELSAAFGGQAAVALRVRETAGPPAFDFLLAVESSGLAAGHSVLRGVRSLLPLLGAAPVEAGDDLMIFEAPGSALDARLELLADFNAVYFGSESLILADKQTLVAVPRLTDSEPFRHDRAFFLPGATNLAYIHLPPLRAMFGGRAASGSPMPGASVELRSLLDSFDSFWISARTEAARSVTRLAFTLAP